MGHLAPQGLLQHHCVVSVERAVKEEDEEEEEEEEKDEEAAAVLYFQQIGRLLVSVERALQEEAVVMELRQPLLV